MAKNKTNESNIESSSLDDAVYSPALDIARVRLRESVRKRVSFENATPYGITVRKTLVLSGFDLIVPPGKEPIANRTMKQMYGTASPEDDAVYILATSYYPNYKPIEFPVVAGNIADIVHKEEMAAGDVLSSMVYEQLAE